MDGEKLEIEKHILSYVGGAGGSTFWLGLFLYKAGVGERERRATAQPAPAGPGSAPP